MPSQTNWGGLGALSIALSLVACGERDAPPTMRIPTYHADVAPLLATHCESCHAPGQIGPFSFMNYADARLYAGLIHEATAERSMPPFILDNSGTCNTYIEAEAQGRWLSDAQIEMIAAWARAGAPEGDPKDAVPAEPKPRLMLDRVDKTIDMGTEYNPDPALFDDYRCFILDPGFVDDQMITGFDVRPGVAKMVHHLTLYSIDTPESEAAAEALDAAEPGLGYSCIDDIKIDDARWLVGWGPGGGALNFPEGTGLRMRAGRKTLLQMHYNQENGVLPDRTQIDLKLERFVPHEASVRRVADTELNLPPRQPSVDETESLEAGTSVNLWGLWPHMHKLGRKMLVEAIGDDDKARCLAKVHRYDFHWQGFSHYTKPNLVKEGEKMRITCTYDTMVRDTATTWGQGTMDEMCIAFFYMTKAD